ncbi:hypothetical protein [Mitsuokella multacida]|uniref:Uncharacterized protein n=1 Tax=Mitsuokella multacida DSM 20544 TaxID=500635 RepID=C9KJC9_9FIRM|nr:hypothetical protein [Mitsuokella multacida]EEX69995.1 hypothetical protein MITSMUL_03126 [Mitsuokella multacida DSM 20544]
MKRFIYESYTEYYGNNYITTTKIYAVIPKAARNAIAKAENWDGCHWDAPAVVYSESVEGTTMSDQAATVIDALKAEEYEEDE